ncbi:ankyrin repeat domain-containing protein [Methylovulum psychrotolerans]|uniref:Uncharacterized protein n=1 Tax=Methylovulum psychrotolerans TaxID=1704499 RepID=A0A1Z4BVM8_9GAMM|nr:ankyrin repeat domain-containing protein [Methylovulum psychrotolerans]ASF45346.1 hypothetical protein CEK71_04285 [Methylovulum psychrotolerans]
MKLKAKMTVNDRIVDDNYHRSLSPGMVYSVVQIDDEYFRVINDDGEPILYPKALFEVVDPSVPEEWVTITFDDGEYFIGPAEFNKTGFYEDYFDGVADAVDKFESFRKEFGLPALKARKNIPEVYMMDAKGKLEELLKKYQKQVQFEALELTSPDQLGVDQDSPFHLACWRGDIDDANIMIAGGADLNLAGDLGDTPLHYAVRMQREDVIVALLAAGAISNLKNDYDDTPLDIAENEGNQEIIALLTR